MGRWKETVRSLACFTAGRSAALSSEKPRRFATRKDRPADQLCFFEAIAYQMICIHPLSDTNGRVTRTLLINLAGRYRNLYPLYIAHCLSFAKQRTGQTWMQASSTATSLDLSNSDMWLDQINLILQKISDLVAAGLDPRVLWSLLSYGYVSEDTLCAGKNACSPALAANYEAPTGAIRTGTGDILLSRA